MPYSESLAERIRAILGRRRDIAEKKMFGGVGFLLNGNMCVGVWKTSLIVRLDPADYEQALQGPHVAEFDITGRPMKGWVMVEPDGFGNRRPTGPWVEQGGGLREPVAEEVVDGPLGLIPRHARIDRERPGVDAAGEVLNAGEALLPQEVRHSQAAAAVVAVDDDPLVAMRLELAQARLQLAHRDQRRPFDLGDGILVGIADIEQHERLVRIPELLDGLRIDLDGKIHGIGNR